MSNIINSLNLQLNAAKGYNPYRNADGTFANGPAAMGLSSFMHFAGHIRGGHSKNEEAIGNAETALDGMLRMGANIKSNANYFKEAEATKRSVIAMKVLDAQKANGSFDNRHFGEELTTAYNKLSKPTFDVAKNLKAGKKVSPTVIKRLESVAKSYASKIDSVKGDHADIYNIIYSSAAAIANTMRAVGLDGDSSK